MDVSDDELARWAVEMARLTNAENWNWQEVAIAADWHYGAKLDRASAVALRLAIRSVLRERGVLR